MALVRHASALTDAIFDLRLVVAPVDTQPGIVVHDEIAGLLQLRFAARHVPDGVHR